MEGVAHIKQENDPDSVNSEQTDVAQFNRSCIPSFSNFQLNPEFSQLKQEVSSVVASTFQQLAAGHIFGPEVLNAGNQSYSPYFANPYLQPPVPLSQLSFKASKPSKDATKSASKGRKSKSPNKKPQKIENKDGSPRKKFDRFDGIPEDEVAKKFLPDHLAHNLDILIIGINPGLFAAHKGHHYAGPGNHFWKCLFLSGLTSEQYSAYEDFKMLDFGIGFTNIVARTTRGSADLSRKEIAEGGEILLTKLKFYRPKIAVFNGKGIYEIFSKKKKFSFGKQPDKIDGTDTIIWVMPSSSARCAQLPRAVDKVPFYAALKKLRDNLKGLLPDLKEEEVVFTGLKLTTPKKREIKQETHD